MKIEILGTGCPKCKKLFEHMQQAVRDLNIEADVVKVEDIQEILKAGVMLTPAFSVDGEVKSTGKVLSVDEIKEMLK